MDQARDDHPTVTALGLTILGHGRRTAGYQWLRVDMDASMSVDKNRYLRVDIVVSRVMDRPNEEGRSDMPATTTVRIRANSRSQLREIERLTGQGPTEVLARAIDSFRRSIILAETDMAYGALRANPEAADLINAEQSVWDEALPDGLEAA